MCAASPAHWRSGLAAKCSTHSPGNPGAAGRQNHGLLQIDGHLPQLPLHLPVVHTLLCGTPIWKNQHIAIQSTTKKNVIEAKAKQREFGLNLTFLAWRKNLFFEACRNFVFVSTFCPPTCTQNGLETYLLKYYASHTYQTCHFLINCDFRAASQLVIFLEHALFEVACGLL